MFFQRTAYFAPRVPGLKLVFKGVEPNLELDLLAFDQFFKHGFYSGARTVSPGSFAKRATAAVGICSASSREDERSLKEFTISPSVLVFDIPLIRLCA